MKTISKTAILATAFATIVSPLSAHAQVKKLEEERCLHLGSYAEHVVEGIRLGISEKQMLAANVGSKKAPAGTKATMNSIVSFVFTMKDSGSDLRKLVYLKCKAGEYDSTSGHKR